MPKHRILMVENDPEVSHFFRLLAKPYYEVIVAENGHIGYQHANVIEPDLVILDQMTPLSDTEFPHTLRSIPSLQNTPIILLAGKHTSPDTVKKEKLNVDLILKKPVEAKELLEHVHNLLRLVPKTSKTLSIYDIQGYD